MSILTVRFWAFGILSSQVLFLKKEVEKKFIFYQIFIEPKGQHLIKNDSWKQDFFMQIEKEYKLETVFENKEYKLVGMPFYNETLTRIDFDMKLNKYVNSDS